MTIGVEVACFSSEVFGPMVMICRYAFLVACLVGLALTAAPLQAQTSATLNVTVRVVAQCTISAKAQKALALLALRAGRPELLHKCSRGVVSKVNRRAVKVAELRPRKPLPPGLSKKRFTKTTSAGSSDVVLFTVTY